MRAARWLAEVTLSSWTKVTVARSFQVYVARCQPALQQKCAQQHLLVWWAVVCVTHKQTNTYIYILESSLYYGLVLVPITPSLLLCWRVQGFIWCQYWCLFGTLPGACSAADFSSESDRTLERYREDLRDPC